jgi:FAD-dependent urate hydroxylase
VKHGTDLLIIGAGPFGLALSALATRLGMEHTAVGRPMEFWRSHMPTGMLLRSDSTWHLDAAGEFTIERFLTKQGLTREGAEPLSLERYLAYCEWFRSGAGVRSMDATVASLTRAGDGDGFRVRFEDGATLGARSVVLALGMGYFSHVPPEFARMFPELRTSHTRDFVDCERLAGKRVLIVGGRQGSFEWAALLREAGAREIHLSYRHDTPSFIPSDWTWVEPMVQHIAADPGWYRRQTPLEREALTKRLWAEGRLKLEPWLAQRVRRDGIHLHEHTTPVRAHDMGDALQVELSDGTTLRVDHVILATGYKADVARIPFLTDGLAEEIEVHDGFPVLSEEMESSVPGLYFTSACAVQDFGPFFGFTVACRTSARILTRSLQPRQRARLA